MFGENASRKPTASAVGSIPLGAANSARPVAQPQQRLRRFDRPPARHRASTIACSNTRRTARKTETGCCPSPRHRAELGAVTEAHDGRVGRRRHMAATANCRAPGCWRSARYRSLRARGEPLARPVAEPHRRDLVPASTSRANAARAIVLDRPPRIVAMQVEEVELLDPGAARGSASSTSSVIEAASSRELAQASSSGGWPPLVAMKTSRRPLLRR